MHPSWTPAGREPDAPTEWHAAAGRAFAAASALPSESVSLYFAVGRRLAADVVALCDVPHYASSAMDGWAVAAGDSPWELMEASALSRRAATGHGTSNGDDVGNGVGAGESASEPAPSLAQGEAIPIVTGGLVPSGAIGVLRSEHGSVSACGDGDGDASGGRRILARNDQAHSDEPRTGQHIRPAGEEARSGEVVIPAGVKLNPAHVAVAAGCGHDALQVVRLPRVGLLLTGDEVVESGVPAAGSVRDSFGPQLPAFVAMLGGTVSWSRRLPDDLASMVTAIESALDVAVIITTGGTGSSPVDHVHAALRKLGARLLLDGIAMRPGGPSLLAQLPDDRFLVGLPGNPLAAMMGTLTIARPLVAALQGGPKPQLGSVIASRALSGAPGRSILIPYVLVNGAAVPSEWRGSGMLRGLAEADGVLVCPPGGVREGSPVETLPLPWIQA